MMGDEWWSRCACATGIFADCVAQLRLADSIAGYFPGHFSLFAVRLCALRSLKVSPRMFPSEEKLA